jgi:hypothetical protein
MAKSNKKLEEKNSAEQRTERNEQKRKITNEGQKSLKRERNGKEEQQKEKN